MAYSSNGKTYTDHPLMDEICYNCKRILKGIVIKNDILANNKETETSLDRGELYIIAREQGIIPFNVFPISYEVLHEYGYSDAEINVILRDREQMPEADRSSFLKFGYKWFFENFEEENDYYRMLMGLPPYDTDEEYYIWLTVSDIPSTYDEEVDFTIPLHEQPDNLISALYREGTIDTLRETYVGSNYSYMMYLGAKAIDLYDARKAAKWDILYMPNVYYLVEDKFTEFYKINRETYMTKSYQEFFSQTGEYYDQMMILIVLSETFANMITDTPEWYIRRDVFDIRSCQYFLESSGVEFFSEIPLKYQIRIVKNLNNLIKYKSSNKNFEDIIDIFKVDGVSINKYWLFKNRDELEFIASDVNDSYDDYIKDSTYRTPYDDITLQDKYWDSGFDHNDIKDAVTDRDFTIEGTKYMSVEYKVSMEEYLYEMAYLTGLILDSKIYDGIKDVEIAIPTISETSNFNLANLFLFLVVLSNSFYKEDLNTGNETKARIPDMWEGPQPDIDEDHYDWKIRNFPEIYVSKNGRIKGFNSTLDKAALIKTLEDRHSHLRFGEADEIGLKNLNAAEYKVRIDKWIYDLGVNDFEVPGTSITSIKDLIDVYEVNTRCYNKLKEAIITAENDNDKKYLEYIFQELYTRPFDKDLYANGEIYFDDIVDVLKKRDYILYKTYLDIMVEDNISSRQDLIRSVMNDTIDTLEYYLSSMDYPYLYSFTSIASFAAIVKYIYLMVNFFKSYKVYFLDPYYTLIANDKLENTVRANDAFNEYKITYYKWDKSFAADKINGIFRELDLYDPGERNNMYEIGDIYAYYDPDPSMDQNFDGTSPEEGELETTDLDGGTEEDKSQFPYYNINGGYAYGGLIDYNDIDGGEVNTYGQEYHNINGGGVYNPDDAKTDAMGKQQFTYVIDGGSPTGRRFITNTFNVYLVGTELFAEVVVSDRNSFIKTYDDGLYVADDIFPTYEQFVNLKYNLYRTLTKITTELEQLTKEIPIITDKKTLIARIWYYYDPMIHDFKYVLDLMKNDKFKNNLKSYINDVTDAFVSSYTEEDLKGLKWEDLG